MLQINQQQMQGQHQLLAQNNSNHLHQMATNQQHHQEVNGNLQLLVQQSAVQAKTAGETNQILLQQNQIMLQQMQAFMQKHAS